MMKPAGASTGTGEILIAMKKRGFGVGKWNGCGGKLHAGESIEQAAVRELKEEIGVTVAEQDLQKVAECTFHYPTEDVDVAAHVFTAQKWAGEPAETEEMSPRWFSLVQIPYREMWADDIFWLPEVLTGKKVHAEFWFNEDDETIAHHEVVQLT